MRLGSWNVGGWSLKNNDNKLFRDKAFIHSDCDIFCVVETFLRDNESFNIDGFTYFSQNRNNIHKRAKRGSGGVGIFVRNRLFEMFTVTVLDETVEDILWLKLCSKQSQDNLVVCVCYLPPSDSVRNNDPESFYCTLLEQVYAYQNEGRLFVCGDFNSRVGDDAEYIEGVDDVAPRTVIDHVSNSNGDLLIDFLTDCGLCMINGRIGHNDYTHVSHRGKSVVDFVFVPYEQLIHVLDFRVTLMTDLINDIQLQGNAHVPDHSLITWSVAVSRKALHSNSVHDNSSTSNSASRTCYDTTRIPGNFMSESDNIQLITDAVHRIEKQLNEEKNVCSAYNTFVQIIKNEMDKTIPKRSNGGNAKRGFNKKSLYKPYWNDTLQEAWNSVCEKERLWLRCNGNKNIKQKRRSDYNVQRKIFDKLNRQYKRSYQLSEQQRLKNLNNSNNSRFFWREIGKIGMHNDRKLQIPMEIINEQGVVSADVDVVLDRWKSDYSKLFDNKNVDNFDNDHLREITDLYNSNSVPHCDRDNSNLNADITKEEVKNSIFRSKLRKAPGLDGLPVEVLRNPICIDLLYKIIDFAFKSGTVPRDWNTCLIKPIPKSETNDPRDPLSYRGISLISIPCKIYADILNVRLSKWLEINDILVDEQNGFRSNRSCLEHIYTLYTVINKRKLNKLSTYACFVDAKKAFDTVNRDCLWFKLAALGISGKILKAIQSLYSNVRCSIKVNNYFTPYFDSELGVKQGCRLSPTLFSIYINDLAEEIKSLNCGIDLDIEQLSLLLYADDVVLLAPTEEALQRMLDKLSEWGKKWRLMINKDKTKIVHFRPKGIKQTNFMFSCGELDLSIVKCYKYLGLWFEENLDMAYAARELAKSASRALSSLYTKFLHLGGMDYEVFNTLYESLVEPVLYYGAGIWGLAERKIINTVQNKACRYFLGLGKNAANIASRGDMGWSSCITKQKTEVSRLFFKLKSLDDDRLVKRIFNWSMSHGKSWENRFTAFINSIDLSYLLTEIVSSKTAVKCIKAKLINIDKVKWEAELWDDSGRENGNKLRTYRIYKTGLFTEDYVKVGMNKNHRRVLSRFRSGCLPLHIETGRYAKPKVPLNERICKFCTEGNVEDEMHFLLHCEFYSDIRRQLLLKANLINTDFNAFSTKDKFIFIMNNINIQHTLASTLYQMLRRRKVFI